MFGWNYFHGTFYLAYKEVLNVLGTALIVGVLVMMARRAIARPREARLCAALDRAPGEPQFDRRGCYRLGDWAFVGILLVIALTGFLLEGVRIAMDHPGDGGGDQFGGWVMACADPGAGPAPRTRARGFAPRAVVALHGLLAIAFVASIPLYEGVAHARQGKCARSPAPRPARRPAAGAAVAPERAEQPAGYGALADFSVQHLIGLDACTKCGRCHAASLRATPPGAPLSPRDLILDLREQANHAAASARHRRLSLGALVASRRYGAVRAGERGETPSAPA